MVSLRVAIVGKRDLSQDEFALAPDHYAQYPSDFPSDVDFTYGVSDPATEWSYIEPGPADSWAGGKAHTFTFRFNLAQVPSSDLTFTAWLLDTQNKVPPVVQVGLNGASVQTVSLPRVAATGTTGGMAGPTWPREFGRPHSMSPSRRPACSRDKTF
jgi:hypothetical protein